MSKTVSSLVLGLAGTLAFGSAAAAFDNGVAGLVADGADVIVDVGIGGLVSPSYEGASKYVLSPMPIARLDYLRLPGLVEIGPGARTGFYAKPSFRFLGERHPSDAAALRGLAKVDWTFEAGAKVGYQGEFFDAFIAARRGFNGHEGFVGDAGLDLIARPSDRLTVKAGPRASFGSNEYVDAYFAVTAAEAVTSGYRRYNPAGGLVSLGAEAELVYGLTERVSLTAVAGYRRLMDDVAASPIVRAGSADQFFFGAGLSYRFGIDLFD